MRNIDRRSLLHSFGIGSVTLMLPAQVAASGKVAVAKPGENRYAFTSATQAKTSPCKVSSEDSGGACTVFELNALPRSGPFLHVHHREDEWYYVLSGEFIFRASREEYKLLAGGSIWFTGVDWHEEIRSTFDGAYPLFVKSENCGEVAIRNDIDQRLAIFRRGCRMS